MDFALEDLTGERESYKHVKLKCIAKRQLMNFSTSYLDHSKTLTQSPAPVLLTTQLSLDHALLGCPFFSFCVFNFYFSFCSLPLHSLWALMLELHLWSCASYQSFKTEYQHHLSHEGFPKSHLSLLCSLRELGFCLYY